MSLQERIANAGVVYLLIRGETRTHLNRTIDLAIVEDGHVVIIGPDVAAVLKLPYNPRWRGIYTGMTAERLAELLSAKLYGTRDGFDTVIL